MRGPTGPAGTLMAWTVGLMLACAAVETCSGCASAPKFSTADWVLQGAFAAEAAVDGLETVRITADGTEMNPFVGAHGQRMPFWLFGIVAYGLELGAARVMPRQYREFWEMFWVGAEGANDYTNAMEGYPPWHF